jgi:HD superfamily phosphohydrolase
MEVFMSRYLNSLNEEVREYFSILEEDFPEWLLEYIETPEMQRISKIALGCGTDYTDVFNVRYWYSNLDHSVGVALIIWHFTRDKKQTLAGLFHDIATPVFKHVIDFLNGDHERQESTEEKTSEIIKNSKEIMALLKRDNIRLEEVNDYKLYPIADNETPQLSADRFEYNFSSGMIFHRVWELEDIRECYNNVIILKNEDGISELGFKDQAIAEKYISTVSKLWPAWITNPDKAVMQFLADMIKAMYEGGHITLQDLYTLSEEEVINKIRYCEDKYLKEAFNKFQKAKIVYDSEKPVKDKYCVSINAKRRYIVPLVHQEKTAVRINKISEKAKTDIDTYLNFKTAKWAYFDFDFSPNTRSNIFVKKIK